MQQGYAITGGVSSSNKCQDPNGCTASGGYNQQVPLYQPPPSTYDSTVAPVVLPDTPPQNEVPMASRPLPQQTNEMLGLGTPTPPQGPQCQPGDPYSPCAQKQINGYSTPVRGLPMFQTDFAYRPGQDAQATAGQAAGAAQLLALAGFDPGSMRNMTVAALAGDPEAVRRSNSYTAMGIPTDVAAAMAQEDLARSLGLGSIWQAGGSADSAAKAVLGEVGARQAQGFMLGTDPSAGDQLLYDRSPGVIYYTPQGLRRATTGGGQTMERSAASVANPLMTPALISPRSGQQALPLQLAQAGLKAQQARELEGLKATNRFTADIARDARRLEIRNRNATASWRKGLTDAQAAAMLEAYEPYEDEMTLEDFVKETRKLQREKGAASLRSGAQTTPIYGQ